MNLVFQFAISRVLKNCAPFPI